MPTIVPFRLAQRGKETVRGDAVAASARWIGNLVLKEDDKYWRPSAPYGVLTDYYSPGIQVAKGATLSYEPEACTFEEIIDFLIMGLKGGVTPTGGGADKTWTFTHSPTADPVPTTFTVEGVRADGSSDFEREVEYVFATELGFSGAIDDVWKLRTSMVGRQSADSTKTGALGVPTLEQALFNKTRLYIDSTWAGLGGTEIVGQLTAFDLAIKTGLFPGPPRGSDGLFSAYHFGPISFDFTATVEFNTTINAERAYRKTPTRRFVRLETVGSLISSLNKKIQFNFAGVHMEDSIAGDDSDREGQDTVELHLHSVYDPTGAADIQAVVINALAALA